MSLWKKKFHENIGAIYHTKNDSDLKEFYSERHTKLLDARITANMTRRTERLNAHKSLDTLPNPDYKQKDIRNQVLNNIGLLEKDNLGNRWAVGSASGFYPETRQQSKASNNSVSSVELYNLNDTGLLSGRYRPESSVKIRSDPFSTTGRSGGTNTAQTYHSTSSRYARTQSCTVLHDNCHNSANKDRARLDNILRLVACEKRALQDCDLSSEEVRRNEVQDTGKRATYFSRRDDNRTCSKVKNTEYDGELFPDETSVYLSESVSQISKGWEEWSKLQEKNDKALSRNRNKSALGGQILTAREHKKRQLERFIESQRAKDRSARLSVMQESRQASKVLQYQDRSKYWERPHTEEDCGEIARAPDTLQSSGEKWGAEVSDHSRAESSFSKSNIAKQVLVCADPSGAIYGEPLESKKADVDSPLECGERSVDVSDVFCAPEMSEAPGKPQKAGRSESQDPVEDLAQEKELGGIGDPHLLVLSLRPPISLFVAR